MKYLCAFLISLVSCSGVLAEEEPWPSQAQIDFVAERFASFPFASFIKDVDWYSPLETVKGRKSYYFDELFQDYLDAWGVLDYDSIVGYEYCYHEETKKDYPAALDYLEEFDNYAFIVWQRGRVRFEKYWPGFDKASRYDTASMHKTVVGLLTGIAQSDGYIDSVEDPISDYLPELQGEQRGEIPLRAFLEMSSGVKSPGFSSDPASINLQTYLGNDLATAISYWPIEGQPFEEFAYANANTANLGLVLERATGKRYADYLSKKLWQRIGAADARLWLDKEGGIPRFSCCLQASARDWLRIGILILNEGRWGHRQVVPKKWMKKMTSESQLNPNYGWQIWRASPYQAKRYYSKETPVFIPAAEPFAREDTLFLDGSGGQRVYIVPSEDMVIVRIGASAPTWDDSALPNAVINQE